MGLYKKNNLEFGGAWLRLLWISKVMIDMAVDRYGLIGWLAIAWLCMAWYAFVGYGLALMDMTFYGED